MRNTYRAALAAGTAMLLAGALPAAADDIVIYTNWSNDHVDAFKPAFEAANPGITATFFRAPIEELFTMIDLETQTGQLRADVIVFGDPTRAAEMKAAGLLAPIDLDQATRDVIDDKLEDPDGIAVPYMIQPVVVQYNKNAVPSDLEMGSWSTLLDPRLAGKVAMGDPRVTGMVHPALWTVTEYLGERDAQNFGWAFVDKLVAQQPRLETGHRGIRDLVALGESAIAIQTVDNAVRSVSEGEPTSYFYPKEGTPALYQSVGVIAQSEELESAKTFARWMVSQEGQALVNTIIGALPVRDDVEVALGESISEMRDRAEIIVMGPELTQAVRENQTTEFYKRLRP